MAAFWLALALCLALACAKPPPQQQSGEAGWWGQQRRRAALASAEESAAPVVEGSYDFVDIRVFYRTIPLDYEQRFLADKAPGEFFCVVPASQRRRRRALRTHNQTQTNKHKQHLDVATVLLLHGKRFTSSEWAELRTLARLHAAGFRAVAIDLPGHGRTAQLPYLDHNLRAELVHSAFAHFNATDRVLVAPSMAGLYALPYIELYGNELLAFAPVAPAGVRAWEGPGIPGRTVSQLLFFVCGGKQRKRRHHRSPHARRHITHNLPLPTPKKTQKRKINTLAIYGANDPRKAELPHLLNMFTHARSSELGAAGHACYVDAPREFNDRLVEHCKDAVTRRNHTRASTLF